MLKAVNTQSWSPYYNGQIARTLASLTRLGVNFIRDHVPAPHPSFLQTSFIETLAKGFQMILTCSTGCDIATTIAALESLERTYAGSIYAIEGWNEVNNFPPPGVPARSAQATAAGLAYQAQLYTAVKASPILSHVPVINFTNDPAPKDPAICDVQNMHLYPHKVANFGTFIPGQIKQVRKNVPGKPLWVTEFGYNTPPPNALWTPAEAGANYATTLPMLAAQGVELVAAFELFDQAGGWGLFQNDGTITPSGVAFAGA